MQQGVPVESLALYGRWWQLEVWLRQLAYVVLRAAWGRTWEAEVNNRAVTYAAKDNLVHLVSPDQPDLLGYLDFGMLLNLIADNWKLFEPFLLERVVWDGRAAEMRTIRNRVGHLRRAGTLDRARIEHLLADLEPGFRAALRALSSVSAMTGGKRLGDPVLADYASGRLGSACSHLRRKYRFDVELSISQMPWARMPVAPDPISGTAGFMWHLDIGGPDRFVDPSRLAEILAPARDSIVYVFADSAFGAQVVVPAVDDVADVLNVLAFFAENYPSCTVPIERVSIEDAEIWPGDVSGIDSRVLVEHLFAIAPPADAPGTIFGV
jgi:hypothetical protein